MKLWQKAVLCTLAAFVLCLTAAMGISARESARLNRELAHSIAQSEYALIARSVGERLTGVQHLYTEFNAENLKFYLMPYARYYSGQSIYLSFFYGGDLIYSSATEKMTVDSPKYLTLTSALPDPFSAIELAYTRDISYIEDQRIALIRFSLIIGAALSAVLAVAVVLMLKALTRPLDTLNRAAAKIAGGAYGQRVSVRANDEIGAFAATFNAMAEAIEMHIVKLNEMTEDRQRFVDNLAHELRTPITAIIGYAEYLELANSSETDRLTALQHISAQGHRIQALSEKLLAISRLHHESALEFAAVDLRMLALRAAQAMAGLLDEKNVRVQITGDGMVIGDADLLESLILNLLENALRATPSGGRIEVELRDRMFAVTDHGAGISPEALNRITEPFYRVDASRSRAYGGAGLGLALAKEICAVHGARMSFISTIAEGTTVRVEFPAQVEFTNPQ